MKKNTQKILALLTPGVLFTPAIIAFAEVTTFKELIDTVFINGLLKPLVPFLIGLAVVIFLYGVILFMFSEGGEKKEEGKEYMFWGIIGIFVMVSVWGLVAILGGTFNLDNDVQNIQLSVPIIT